MTEQETLPGQPELSVDHEWQRLDPRMLLVHPVREVLRFLPVLIGIFVAGTASGGGPPWHYLGVAIPIVLGLLRYLTTRFRIAEGRVELARGLLNRQVTSTPLDRVRTVDLTASPIHRVLGLTMVRIGTGVGGDADSLDLDGLPTGRAHELRRELLRVSGAEADSDEEHGAAAPDPPLVEFDRAWVRFAPLTSTGLVVAAAVFGGLSQLLNSLDAWDDLDADTLPVPSGLAVAVSLVGVLVAVVALSVVGFVVVNGGFRLTRAAGSWHVRRGLLTTRETSIDEDRLAGVALGEPLALRIAGGRHLNAIVTGVDRDRHGSATLVPPSDKDVAPRVAAAILGSEEPLTTPLRDHGPAARRRRWTRALTPAVLLAVATGLVTATGGPWWPLVLALVVVAGSAVVAADRARGLGHALVAGHVVARSGSLARRREALAVGDVIGWNLRATWFQRRVGLTTLVATTAGGGGSVTVLDLSEADAAHLAREALPDLVDQFRA